MKAFVILFVLFIMSSSVAEKIYLQDGANTIIDIDITVGEAGLLQNMVGRSYPPLVVLRAYTLLEGGNKE